MIKVDNSLEKVKKSIFALKEKQVKVTLNLGRNKTEKFFGKLSGVYPALFTVLPDDKDYKGKTSYSYSEYMCGTVKVEEI